MKAALRIIVWAGIALLGAFAYLTIALHRGDRINSAHLVLAALCTYAIGYRFYSKWIAARVLALDDRRATPAEVHDDGKDFVKTNPWIVFGHHFAAISGPGPLVGPVLAAQFGYLPGTLWILIGVVLGGAVQDFVILFCSLRRDGKSLGQMVKEELNTVAGYVALVAVLGILVILLAVLALVVVRALAESPWGVFTVGATIPIAMFMGCYLRYLRPGKVLEATAIGVALLLLAVWGGRFVHADAALAARFTLLAEPLAWAIIVYGLAASILPVWLLLAPRDYLSTFMKLGTIFALALGILIVLPDLKMPALTRFVDGSGLVFSGKLFPFCFITIACGAISGFHTLIASGTTPKLIARERYARPIGYGAMCLESLVAMMAMIAACTLEPGVYLSMNIKGEPAATIGRVNAVGFAVTQAEMDGLATMAGEKTLFGRTGGATTLAVGMARIFSDVIGGRALDLWYHFAVMFEALFILTTIDAGTRVGRYLLQDFLGQLWRPLGDTRRLGPNILASALLVAAWGWFLIQGVRDPLGGINSLWPLFGIANQLLAALALCLATTILVKTQMRRAQPALAMALVTLVPLMWLIAVTMTAAWQKVFHDDPRIGFLAQATALERRVAESGTALAGRRAAGAPAAEVAALAATIGRAKAEQFNMRMDAAVATAFMALIAVMLGLSAREWVLLVTRRRSPELRETEPVWIPLDPAATARPAGALGAAVLALAVAKELAGETAFERARAAGAACATSTTGATSTAHGAAHRGTGAGTGNRAADTRAYLAATAHRYGGGGIRRCC